MKPRIALALSGGGFRAALFHIGVLRRLAELGWLQHVDLLSTVSGGSIIGAFMALRWQELLRRGGDWSAFEQCIARPFIEIISQRNFIRAWAIRLPIVLAKKVFDRSYTRTDAAAELLGRWFFHERTCAELPERPYLVVNATTLLTMRSWRFTRDGMGDSRIGHTTWNGSPVGIGKAVGASAAFPPVFPPARIELNQYQFTGPIYGEPEVEKHPLVALSDGGVYDNLGVEVTIKSVAVPGRDSPLHPADFLVVSDAGAPTPTRFRPSGVPMFSSALLLYRVDAIAREQVSAQRRRDLVRSFADPNSTRKGLLVMLGSQVRKIPGGGGDQYAEHIGAEHLIPADLVARIQRIRTHLDQFSAAECEALMYHAYLMTDAFLWAHRKTCPAAYCVAAEPSPKWLIEFSSEKVAEWDRVLPK